jgi:hypothetical protein
MIKIESFVLRLEHLVTTTLQAINRMLTALVVLVSIWAADAVVSIMTGNNLITFLNWPTIAAVMAAIALEGTGVMSSMAALELHRFNQERGALPAAPEGLAWGVAATQIAISILIMALSAFASNGILISAVLLALLSATGTAAMMLHEDCQTRQKSLSKAVNVALAIDGPEQEPLPVDEQASTRDRVYAYFVENAHDTNANAARLLGIKPGIVGHWRRQLIAEGAIDANGTGTNHG